MKHRVFLIGSLSIFYFVIISLSAPVYAHGMDLVGLLTKNLGVTSQQAKGGAGSIFNTASKKMSVEDFSRVTEAMPEVTSLMNAAPRVGSGSGTLGGLSSMLKKSGGSLGTLTELSGAFSKLGLSSGMVSKFIPIILGYAQSKGGDTIANLLKTALQ